MKDEKRLCLEYSISKNSEERIEIQNEIVLRNQGLVVNISKNELKNYRYDSEILNDIIQEGNIGLLLGIQRYDINQGSKLSTYVSWYIKMTIKKAIKNKLDMIRIPVHMLKMRKKTKLSKRQERLVEQSYINNRRVYCLEGVRSDHNNNISELSVYLNKLDPQSRTVIEKHYGVNGETKTSLKEIGKELHISKKRVLQLERLALNYMRA